MGNSTGAYALRSADLSYNRFTAMASNFCPALFAVFRPYPPYTPAGPGAPAALPANGTSLALSCRGNNICTVPACLAGGNLSSGNAITPATFCGACPASSG